LELNDIKTIRSVIKQIRDKKYRNSPKVVANKWLKQALGGSDAEISIPGYKEDPSEKLRRANALRQYHDRVYEGNEKPWEVAQDLWARSIRANDVKLSGFPRPRFGPEKNNDQYDLEDINKTRIDTMMKFKETLVEGYNGVPFSKIDFSNQLKDLNAMHAIILLKERQMRIDDQKPTGETGPKSQTKSRVEKAIGK